LSISPTLRFSTYSTPFSSIEMIGWSMSGWLEMFFARGMATS